MKFILSEKYILNEAENGDANPMNITFDSDNNMDIAANLDDDATFDFKSELESAEKTGNKKLAESIWNKFYNKFSKESGISVDELRNLGVAFRVECLNLGFTEALNPFLKFLKLHKDLVPAMNSQSYGAVHNSYTTADNYGNGNITKADLLGTGVLNTSNLIFNKALYGKTANDVIEYLKLQGLVINKFNNNDNLELNLDGKVYNNAIDTINGIFINGGQLVEVNIIKDKLAQVGISENSLAANETALKTAGDVDKLVKTSFKQFIDANDKASLMMAMLLLINSAYKNENKKQQMLRQYNITTKNTIKSIDPANLPSIMTAVEGINWRTSTEGMVDKLLSLLGNEIK